MTEPQITIVGLGLVGGSIGLALKASGKNLRVIGHDAEPRRNRLAHKLGAVDKGKFNLIDACKDADLVVIATPVHAIRETLEIIGPHLKPGCVVTDTATLKEPVLDWAAETLPESISFVGGDPVLSPVGQARQASLNEANSSVDQRLGSARADLFQDAFYILCPSPSAAPEAVKRVSDMVTLLKARAFFVDPAEHDGLRAAVEGLPAVTGLALMRLIGGSPDWREARKVADHVLGMATASLTGEAAPQRAQILLNAGHLLPRIDALIAELSQLRQWVAAKEDDDLEEALDEAIGVRTRWLVDRSLGNWDERMDNPSVPGTMGSLGDMLGLGGRLKKGRGK